jgi:hypothetical protein
MPRAAMTIDPPVRSSVCGKNDGLKKATKKLRSGVQSPEVSG